MQLVEYYIDGKKHQFSVDEKTNFSFGENLILSNQLSDITFTQPWYDIGYGISKFVTDDEFEYLKKGLTDCVKNLIEKELGYDTTNFELEKYHHIIKTDQDHFKIVSKTRDLFSKDFNFDIEEMIPKFEKILGFNITDIDDLNGSKAHIIVRINRPKSKDFNPPHKDSYEAYDEYEKVSKFMNFWIPICGVTTNSSLPLSPKSHLIPESKIERTFTGAIVEGNKYRVRIIKNWGGGSSLVRTNVKYGEVLMFSSQLIHGLAFNDEDNETRVALEFRLFKKN